MAAARITETPVARTNRHDRAALGVVASYLRELTDHGQSKPRRDESETVTELSLHVDDDLVDCLACAA